ncbi:bifunctional precorrin-2 dehydrogenase/sirohydrochlorin ferrochelatase [Halogeometricum sp. S1BR25-6]|uniref:precorrin-2 dehydrogenase n=1 Tax=Halogeometricum salsisoli TaxID=2950536 RepID=A0ABU2GH32_9EURY|nr:bifunctional precorrin-2 dehydrogenase/sirohydrochlorin ferrochelatase [Halogeometricum sp. S1BR25-6]MDS0299721.1 bifunctional precorrin-2 dehydrogenase/sirohydrochlorin ferrochelatase [Halogeometricum sp. S1BR25-6]
MIPLYHDFTEESVLVFGGGAVGARKARRFAEEADVTVVAPSFECEADDYGGAELVEAAPAPASVADWVARYDPALVVAATDDEAVNDAAERAAREAGAMVNRADASGDEERDARSVVVPATVEDGDVRVAISTGGASPALAKHLRERIETEIEGAGAMADLTGRLRTELRESDRTPRERRDAVRAVVRSEPVWKALRTGKSKARQEADRVIRNTRGGER